MRKKVHSWDGPCSPDYGHKLLLSDSYPIHRIRPKIVYQLGQGHVLNRGRGM